jgi:hypothetical protein
MSKLETTTFSLLIFFAGLFRQCDGEDSMRFTHSYPKQCIVSLNAHSALSAGLLFRARAMALRRWFMLSGNAVDSRRTLGYTLYC